jgi:hypothetical protein
MVLVFVPLLVVNKSRCDVFMCSEKRSITVFRLAMNRYSTEKRVVGDDREFCIVWGGNNV